MNANLIAKICESLPAGRWGVGVSGGADSVALLLLLHGHPDLSLHVVHLDHETRDGESAADAAFVAGLAAKLNVSCTIALRSMIEVGIKSPLKNTSARFRHARFSLFEQVVEEHQLMGIILAHHADDQVETVLQKILRGGGAVNLSGMQPESKVQKLKIVRPLLSIRAASLREFLRQNGQTWREDSSNQSDKYQRNRLRHWLRNHPGVAEGFLQLGETSNALAEWLDRSSPQLGSKFDTTQLSKLPNPLAVRSAAQWLMRNGSPPREVNQQTCERLMEMASDAASSTRQHFPGSLLVRRKRGAIFADDLNDVDESVVQPNQ